jgi:hypothetical protein
VVIIISYISQNCLFCLSIFHFKCFKYQSPTNNFKSLFFVACQPGTLYYSSLCFRVNNSRSRIFPESKVGPWSVQTPLKMYSMFALIARCCRPIIIYSPYFFSLDCIINIWHLWSHKFFGHENGTCFRMYNRREFETLQNASRWVLGARSIPFQAL